MHLAPKRILINAHINLRDNLATDDVEQTITEIEERIKRAEPKVQMIFLETARASQTELHEPIAEHMG
jgi:divalent metal cation (Fe/Co/Zn/Cd) transporter